MSGAHALAATRGLHRGLVARVRTATAAARGLPIPCGRRLLGPAVRRALGKSASLDRGRLTGALEASAPVASNQIRSEHK